MSKVKTNLIHRQLRRIGILGDVLTGLELRLAEDDLLRRDVRQIKQALNSIGVDLMLFVVVESNKFAAEEEA